MAKDRVIDPRGGIFRITMDLRDGKEYITHVSMGTCPFKSFHVQMRDQGKTCYLCNGKDNYLRFEEMRVIRSVKGDQPGDVRVRPKQREPLAQGGDGCSPTRETPFLQIQGQDESPDTHQKPNLQEEPAGNSQGSRLEERDGAD